MKINRVLSFFSKDYNSLIEKSINSICEEKFKVETLKKLQKKNRLYFILSNVYHACRLFFCKRHETGIIISWSDYYCGMFYACLCRLFHVRKTSPIILMAFIYNVAGRFERLRRIVTRYAVRSKYIDYVVVFSKGEINYYHKLLDIPKTKIYFFPLSKDMSHFIPKVLPIKGGEYVFSVGSTNRDYSFLINIWDDCEYNLHIACDTLKKPLNTKNITVHNQMFNNEMWQYMYNSYCVVIPLKGEKIISSGQLALLQAMYMKKPIICTKGSCIADYLKDGYNALLVDNNKKEWLHAIERLYTDTKLYKRLAENGYNDFMKKHKTECLVTNISTLIDTLNR